MFEFLCDDTLDSAENVMVAHLCSDTSVYTVSDAWGPACVAAWSIDIACSTMGLKKPGAQEYKYHSKYKAPSYMRETIISSLCSQTSIFGIGADSKSPILGSASSNAAGDAHPSLSSSCVQPPIKDLSSEYSDKTHFHIKRKSKSVQSTLLKTLAWLT